MSVVAFFFFAAGQAHAFPAFQSEIPNGAVYRCLTCHTNTSVGEGWNPFGLDVLRQRIDPDANPENDKNNGPGGNYTGSPEWDLALCELDSDGDGQTNGEELGDPNCVFVQGETPERRSDISNPGNPASMSADPTGTDPVPEGEGEGEGGGENVPPQVCACASKNSFPDAALVLILFALGVKPRRSTRSQ